LTLNPTLHENEEICPNSLRACVTAPDTTKCRGKQKKAKARHDQKARDEVEFMRPNFDPEKIEAAMRHVYQHGLIR